MMEEDKEPLITENEENEEHQNAINNTDKDSSSRKDHQNDDGRTRKHHKSQRIHKDRYNLAYISFFLLGIGMLLPWNFFINADSYFKEKLKNNKDDLEMFESAFSICSQIPCGIALILNLYLTNRVSRNGRVIATLVTSTICFIITTILVNVDTVSWTTNFFAITLTSVAIINFCAGIFQGTIFGIAGAAGGRYIQGAVVGMSIAGTFASVSNIVSLAVGNGINFDSTIYFSIASLVLFACIFVYIGMFRLLVLKAKFNGENYVKPSSSLTSSSANEERNNDEQSLMAVFRRIYPTALSVAVTFAVTLTIQPSILSCIRSVNAGNGSAITNKYFTAVVGFLIFNVGDFTGRIISGFVRVVGKNGPWLPILCCARITFIPLFMFCNYQPRHHLSIIFNHDAYPIVFNILFSVSNGYLASLCMMYGPERAPEGMMETAGATMQLFLTIGLGFGSLLSLAIVNII